jgi:hypothetical protein
VTPAATDGIEPVLMYPKVPPPGRLQSQQFPISECLERKWEYTRGGDDDVLGNGDKEFKEPDHAYLR